jgi:hypothetical protein
VREFVSAEFRFKADDKGWVMEPTEGSLWKMTPITGWTFKTGAPHDE